MSDTLAQAVALLGEKTGGADIGGLVKFDIAGLGAILLDDDGAREGDSDADVTLSADADTFREMLDGDLNPTAAFMSGKLAVDGDMGLAMKLASVLS